MDFSQRHQLCLQRHLRQPLLVARGTAAWNSRSSSGDRYGSGSAVAGAPGA